MIVANRRNIDRSSHSACRGATALETAIVLIVFLILVLGFIDLCLVTFRYNLISQVARQGARIASVHGEMASPVMSSWGPGGSWGPGSGNSIEVDATNSSAGIVDELRTGLINEKSDPGYLAGLELARTQVKVDWLDGDNKVGSRVQVTATTRYRPLFVAVPELTLRAASTLEITH